MQHWLHCRGYEIIPIDRVQIEGYTPPSLEVPFVPPAKEPLYNGAMPLDVDVPHILEYRSGNTISVRVMETFDGRQLFLFIRNYTNVKLKKKDLFALCTDFLPFADGVLFSSRVQPQLASSCIQMAMKYKHVFEMLQLPEARYAKLKSGLVPHSLLLNEADIQQVEKTYLRKRTSFPKIRLSYHDAMARYHGWRPGMVIYEPRSQIYRLVVI